MIIDIGTFSSIDTSIFDLYEPTYSFDDVFIDIDGVIISITATSSVFNMSEEDYSFEFNDSSINSIFEPEFSLYTYVDYGYVNEGYIN